MSRSSDAFVFGDASPVEVVGDGITRQFCGFNDAIMMVRVQFETNSVGAVHTHPHSQLSYIESGEFDVFIDGEEKRLGAGDSFCIQPHLEHGSVCRKAGVIIDVFSPAREDFLSEDKT